MITVVSYVPFFQLKFVYTQCFFCCWECHVQTIVSSNQSSDAYCFFYNNLFVSIWIDSRIMNRNAYCFLSDDFCLQHLFIESVSSIISELTLNATWACNILQCMQTSSFNIPINITKLKRNQYRTNDNAFTHLVNMWQCPTFLHIIAVHLHLKQHISHTRRLTANWRSTNRCLGKVE